MMFFEFSKTVLKNNFKKQELSWACLVLIFENTKNTILELVWLQFLKTVLCSKNKKNKENRESTFGSQYIFVMKNTKKTKFKEQEPFSKNR